jgi:hypothetical protein
MSTQSIICDSLTPPWHSHIDVNAAIEDNCKVIRYALTKPQVPSKHNAFLAVLTSRLSLLPENSTEIAPATPKPDNLIFPWTVTQRNLKPQKKPKTHHFLPLTPFC